MNRITCGRIRRRLVEYLYGEITGGEEQRVKAHLETCSSCREVWEGMRIVSRPAERPLEPEPPAAFWKFYPKRVLAKISEEKTLWQVSTGYAFIKKFLVPCLSGLVFFFLVTGGARFYLIEKEIAKNHELYHDLEIIWNLDLINQVVENEVFASGLPQQPSEPKPWLQLKKEIHHKFHQFKRLPVSEKNLIVANYQRWTKYSASKKKMSRSVYHRLKTVNHPDLKRPT